MNSTAYTEGAQCRWMNGGRRLHLQHGPIDLVIGADGDSSAVQAAYARAIDAFPAILPVLAAELPLLRAPITPITSIAPCSSGCPSGEIARQMFDAASAYAGQYFITPMVAVAGAVADQVLAVMLSGQPVDRASVNNGGDIALYLQPGESFKIGVCDNMQTRSIASTIKLNHSDRVGGIATSGWAGRSHSFGIADAVTVLACNAVQADCAATIIANAIDLPGSTKIQREPATALFPDSDLGDSLVTVGVDQLSGAELDFALQRGQLVADELLANGRIRAAFLSLQGKCLIVNDQDNAIEGFSKPRRHEAQSLNITTPNDENLSLR